MRRLLQYAPAAAAAILLAACAIGWYLTAEAPPARTTAQTAATPIDERLIGIARELAARADTAEEKELGREAERLADNEVDQAFASALREAAASPLKLTGPLKQLADRVTAVAARVAAGQTKIAQLEKSNADNAAEDLALARAQLALDQDELEDAQQDLARQGGDPRSSLERALKEHQARHAPQASGNAQAGPTATLADQLRAWIGLGDRARDIDAARRQAASRASGVSRQHDTLEQIVTRKPVTASPQTADEEAPDGEEEDSATLIARLRKLSDQRKALADFDRREQDLTQLADVYARWSAAVGARRQNALHLMLRSLGIVLAILLAAFAATYLTRRFLSHAKDRRRHHQLRVIVTIALEVAAAAAILLVVFGTPAQTTTIIGLTTAGLTVALKDFIVAFFGWIVLIGKNGIRIGDWVEIEGVGGEVIEIGLLKTVLLEMGNWTNTGHPTGRRVSFVNKFAIENHYFNFSTAGQWLWDELQVTLPLTSNPYSLAQQIRDLVERETDADSRDAEKEWARVTSQYGTREFSARPAMDLRPTVNGLDVVVRYITHAPQRLEVKSRLFESIVGLLQPRETA